MTDHDMDARLRGAGERWREQESPVAVDDSSADEILVHLPPPRRSHTRWITAASAAVVAAALIIGGGFVVRHDDTGNKPVAADPAASSIAAKLIGPTWTVQDTNVALVFSKNSLRITGSCTRAGNEVHIDGDHLTVGKTIGSPQKCAPGPMSPARQKALQEFDKVVTGAVTWSVSGNTLMLSKAGAGSLELTRPLESSDLAGINWGVSGTPISMVFSAGTVRTFDGCDNTTRRITFAAGRATLGEPIGMASTCSRPSQAPGAPTSVDRFDSIVRGTFAVARNGNRLTLTKAGSGSIALTGNGAAPDLIGSYWRLSSIADDKSETLSHVATSTTFHVDSDGTLTTDDGCGNAMGGHVITTDTTFRFTGDLARTEIGCTDQVLNKGATTISDVLSGTVQWSIRGNELILSRSARLGQLVYELTSAPTTPTAGDLQNTSWNLTNVQTSSGSGANGSTSMLPKSVDATLSFTGNSFTLGDGCTEYRGAVAFDTGTVTISDRTGGIRPTVRCSANSLRDNQEAVLQKLFSNGVLGWRIDTGALTLTHFNVAATFGAVTKAAPDVAVAGTSWSLSGTQTDNGNSGSGNSAISRSDLAFAADGTFTMAHRCYTNEGSYSVDGDTVTLFRVKLKEALPCSSNAETAAGQKEDGIVDAIVDNGDTTLAIDAGVLTLTRGNREATFTSQSDGGVAALQASHWTITEIHQGGASEQPSAAMEFNFAPTLVSAGGNETAPATFAGTSMTFTHTWLNTFVDNDMPHLTGTQNIFVFEKVLTGTVSYAISNGTLTITKAGVGAIVLTSQ